MLATVAQAVALSMDRSQSLARRLQRPNHAKVRSTTQRRGNRTKPFAVSDRLMISRVQLPWSLDRGFEFVAGISAIGEDMAQPREPEADGFENIDGAVAVLNVRGVDQDEQQKATGVGDDMPFAALHFLARVIARNPAALRGFDRLAVDDTGAGRGLPTSLLARRHHQQVVNCRQQAAVPPGVKIAAHRRDRRNSP